MDLLKNLYINEGVIMAFTKSFELDLLSIIEGWEMNRK